ncbi:B3 domain-containing protein [Striga asiatica]|uniref:B3 domain-containing protein n=1 Tax=Striga asiatica TaxID=4170 RepID=A0A5A7QHE5_STRAF|nr:B3 domain-containing protein [Striga asiatica]
MDVDTTLRLSNAPPSPRRHRRRKIRSNLARFAREVDSSTFLRLGPATQEVNIEISKNKKKSRAKRKSEDRPGPRGSKPEPGPKKKRAATIPEPHTRLLPPEILNKTGPGLVFLFKKKLQVSDVTGDQNRLFVTAGMIERMKEEFMTEDERWAVWDRAGLGIKLSGVDNRGNEYKLGLATWWSLGMTVIKSGWNRMVKGNEVKAGDWVDVWGCRSPGREGFRLAFNFSAGGRDGA